MERIKIFICDYLPVVCEGLRSHLKNHKNIEIIGEASNSEELIKKIEAVKPEIILIDIDLPHTDGIDAAKSILDKYPGMKIILLLINNDPEKIQKLRNCGAKGFILKNSVFEHLVPAIETAHSGEIYFQPEISSVIKNDYTNGIREISKLSKLTPMERKVCDLIVKGYTN